MRYYISCIFATLIFVGCGGGSGSGGTGSSAKKNPPILDNHSPVTLYKSESITPIEFNNHGGDITSCRVSPSLPSGLLFDSGDCSISGTPTVNQNLKTYTVTAKNSVGEDSATVDIEVITPNTKVAKLKGVITYDSVPVNSDGVGLDYAHTKQKSVRGAVVRIVDGSNKELARTTTDKNGYYEFNVANITSKVKVQVLSELKSSNWDFKVKDNTNSDALYVMEGSLASLGKNSTQTRNLHASSGWGRNSYTRTRTAAPFAILDVVYQAIQKVRTADSSIVFPPLDIFWSKNNKSASGAISNGDIGTSYYDGSDSLYILGDENSDTDEYDSGVIAHEWGHYYESKFSRADSIGGGHTSGDFLDIRLAFGEGFGNAVSSMLRDNPNYWDSSGLRQANGWNMSLETENSRENPGWFSEGSIQRILYDIYDSHNDTGDKLSYGFKPIHQLLIGKEKNTPAFTSIFTFIKGLKDEHPSDATAIDNIVAQESIAPINDIYGSGRTNRRENANPLYDELTTGSGVTIVTNYAVDSYLSERGRTNQLGAYNFVKVIVPSEGDYTIIVSQVGSSGNPDPDFYLYRGSSNQPVAKAENPPALSDRVTAHLQKGVYRMAIVVYNQYSGTSYRVKLVKN